jgi:dTDP-4-dehydrorhamnose reductase
MTGFHAAVVGCHGLLGRHVALLLSREADATTTLIGRRSNSPFPDLPNSVYVQIDLADRRALKDALVASSADVVVNCAAMSDVDGCERERERAWRTNVKGVEYMVEACRKIDARFVHVSTDYVFDGRSGPYAEADKPHPLNYYGRTKLASENVCRTSGIGASVVRTSVLYGTGEGSRPTFVSRVIQALRSGQEMRIVTDQLSNPSFVDDVALGIMRIIEREREGIFHVAGPETVSRFTFAAEVAAAFDLPAGLLVPCASMDLAQVAARPSNAGLVTLKAQTELGIAPMGIAEGLRNFRFQVGRTEASPLPAHRLRS